MFSSKTLLLNVLVSAKELKEHGFKFFKLLVYNYDKIVIYTSRFLYLHQELYIYSKIPSILYIKIRIYTARLMYIHQDSYNIHQDLRVYIMCRNIKICVCTLRFVHIHQDPDIQ